jgi:uncharacterized protein (DUF433 family)
MRIGKFSGARVLHHTRMPVTAVFEDLKAGASIEEIADLFDITREQVNAVLEFAARSLNPIPASTPAANALSAVGSVKPAAQVIFRVRNSESLHTVSNPFANPAPARVVVQFDSL